MSKYGISDSNYHGVLKVAFPLVLIFAFLTRHWWLSIGVMMSRSPEVMGEFFDGSVTYYLVAEFPALLVVSLAMMRKPAAGKMVRGLWKQGFWLLCTSTALNLAMIALLPAKLTVFPPKLAFDLSRLEGAQWGAIAVNMVILGYFAFSARTRDTFAEFPAPAEPAKP